MSGTKKAIAERATEAASAAQEEKTDAQRHPARVHGGQPAVRAVAPCVPPAGWVPDPEVPAKAGRRRFPAEYKLRILREADGCQAPGEVGALLRREGLYSSHLTTWRRQREQGALAALMPKKRGRPAPPAHPLARRVVELEGENTRLQRRLQQAETIIEVQKKVSEILGIPLRSPDGGGSA